MESLIISRIIRDLCAILIAFDGHWVAPVNLVNFSGGTAKLKREKLCEIPFEKSQISLNHSLPEGSL